MHGELSTVLSTVYGELSTVYGELSTVYGELLILCAPGIIRLALM